MLQAIYRCGAPFQSPSQKNRSRVAHTVVAYYLGYHDHIAGARNVVRGFSHCESVSWHDPMFPGIVLYLSGFYTRKVLSLRYASDGCPSDDDHPYIKIALFFSASVRYEVASQMFLSNSGRVRSPSRFRWGSAWCSTC
ncbi:hypothetical protein BYT27DRAFT_7190860 [Phlegmacium glaucopus]|nr:hypothetical protein BYT27DRAFT_7190860 [Phlegmacium glaucopus]